MESEERMKKTIPVIVLLVIVISSITYCVSNPGIFNKRFAIILQAGKESHEGMARAVHALLYATELKERGYEVVLIFDGAGTEWIEEFTDPDSESKLLPAYKAFKKTGVEEIICDYCTAAFDVKEKLQERQYPLASEYKGHPSIVKWVKKGYQLLIL